MLYGYQEHEAPSNKFGSLYNFTIVNTKISLIFYSMEFYTAIYITNKKKLICKP